MTVTCKSCTFMEVCSANVMNCEYYYPIDEDDYIDDMVDNIIDTGRYEYRQEWFSYLEEADDEYFL